jgi:hypothetical protein
VKSPLLADGIHRTDIVTSSAIDTIFGDIVRSHLDTSLLAGLLPHKLFAAQRDPQGCPARAQIPMFGLLRPFLMIW